MTKLTTEAMQALQSLENARKAEKQFLADFEAEKQRERLRRRQQYRNQITQDALKAIRSGASKAAVARAYGTTNFHNIPASQDILLALMDDAGTPAPADTPPVPVSNVGKSSAQVFNVSEVQFVEPINTQFDEYERFGVAITEEKWRVYDPTGTVNSATVGRGENTWFIEFDTAGEDEDVVREVEDQVDLYLDEIQQKWEDAKNGN